MGVLKKLTKIGNSYGVILPKEYLEEAGIDEKTEVEVEVEGNELILKPSNLKDHKILKTFMTVIRDYESTLKRLAKIK